MQHYSPLPRLVFPALTIAICVGCGAGNVEREAVYPVVGSLLFEGRPAVGAIVTFHRATGAPIGEPVRAEVGADGQFTPIRPDGAVGAAAGRYALTVEWPDDGIDRLHGQYANSLQPLAETEVTAGANLLRPLSIPSR